MTRNAEFARIFSSPELSAAAVADNSLGHLKEIAIALECALKEVVDVDAERQLHKLLWLLCKRSGGGLCRRAHNAKPECDRDNFCVCVGLDGRTSEA